MVLYLRAQVTLEALVVIAALFGAASLLLSGAPDQVHSLLSSVQTVSGARSNGIACVATSSAGAWGARMALDRPESLSKSAGANFYKCGVDANGEEWLVRQSPREYG